MSFWDIAWKGGFIWALWHFPLLFILYLPAGVAVLIPSLIGFYSIHRGHELYHEFFL